MKASQSPLISMQRNWSRASTRSLIDPTHAPMIAPLADDVFDGALDHACGDFEVSRQKALVVRVGDAFLEVVLDACELRALPLRARPALRERALLVAQRVDDEVQPLYPCHGGGVDKIGRLIVLYR